MPKKGAITERCILVRSKQPGPHCASVLNVAMRSWALSDLSGFCHTKRKPGRQIFGWKKKDFSQILDKNLSPSVDSLISVETTFNGEHFHLENLVTFARNIFVNNCGVFFPFLQSLSHLCLAVSISLRFYMTVLIFNWHNALIAGSRSPCSVSHCLWNEKPRFVLF